MHIVFENGPNQQRHRREEHIIEWYVPIVEDARSGIGGEKRKINLRHGEKKILIEKVQYHFGNAHVAQPAMQ